MLVNEFSIYDEVRHFDEQFFNYNKQLLELKVSNYINEDSNKILLEAFDGESIKKAAAALAERIKEIWNNFKNKFMKMSTDKRVNEFLDNTISQLSKNQDIFSTLKQEYIKFDDSLIDNFSSLVDFNENDEELMKLLDTPDEFRSKYFPKLASGYDPNKIKWKGHMQNVLANNNKKVMITFQELNNMVTQIKKTPEKIRRLESFYKKLDNANKINIRLTNSGVMKSKVVNKSESTDLLFTEAEDDTYSSAKADVSETNNEKLKDIDTNSVRGSVERINEKLDDDMKKVSYAKKYITLVHEVFGTILWAIQTERNDYLNSIKNLNRGINNLNKKSSNKEKTEKETETNEKVQESLRLVNGLIDSNKFINETVSKLNFSINNESLVKLSEFYFEKDNYTTKINYDSLNPILSEDNFKFHSKYANLLTRQLNKIDNLIPSGFNTLSECNIIDEGMKLLFKDENNKEFSFIYKI